MASDDILTRLGATSPEQPVGLGRYDVIGRLGQGGMGTVYEAVDRERGTRVALKTLSAVDAAAGVRLKREFRVVADVAHENLVPVYELACENGLWFFAMERVDGVGFTRWARGPSRTDRPTAPLPMTQAPSTVDVASEDLTTRLRERRSWPAGPPASPPRVGLDALRAALAQLCRGLIALHEAGLWHGDIKPENVLVRADGHVVVVDFGLVEPVGASRVARGSTAGTPTYMASEQLAGAGAGPASDWYAVGTMIYESLTGRLPFDGDSLLDLYFQKTHQTPPSPRELLPELPVDLSEVCMALLSAAPARRPSGHELLRVLTGDAEARRAADGTARTVFVGRKRELRLLEQAYGLARSGYPMVVHAHGSSGIGKSAMLRSFTRGVEDVDRAKVLRGRCYERESVPYKAFDGIMDELGDHLGHLDEAQLARLVPEWIGELAQVFPALAAVPSIAMRPPPPDLDAVELRRRAWIALRELIAVLTTQQPVVLTIDDLQWADADSARLLEFLVEDPARRHLMVVASYRPREAEANPALADYLALCRRLAGERRFVEIPLGPLPAAEAEQLARSALRGMGEPASEARLRSLTEEAAGVPFFIEELARYSASGPRAGEQSLDDAIRARVRELPGEQRALVEVVAVADSPVPQSLVFAAAGLAAGALPSLLALRGASLLGWSGAGADDLVSTYHDRIREAVVAGLSEDARAARHLALGRAFATRHAGAPPGAWVFQAVRHLGAASALVRDAGERRASARLAFEAGRQARQAAAFPLAFASFERGIAFLDDDAWDSDHELCLGLHSGAAEAAYLSAEWSAMERRSAEVRVHARSVLDQLVAWEVQIDACVGRHEYVAALAVGRQALALLGVELPADPTVDDVGAAFQRTLAELTRVGPDGLAAMPDVSDPTAAAAMRIQVRLAPAAYFGKPLMLPIFACNLVTASVARGLSTATPYALALFGIVLNTVGMYPVSHVWGQLAVKLLERWPDRRLEAATRHVVYNLVCPWMVPLRSILGPLREVWDIGRRTGDLEYASYAAHGWVHNCLYAGLPLAPLHREALELGAQMRALGQVNALHVHQPFEQLLKALVGQLPDPTRFDDAGFSERTLLEASAREGSRSGIFVTRVAMGLGRYLFGAYAEASECLEVARDYLDAGPSVWHIPILHQYAALSACAIWASADEGEREVLRGKIDASLAVLRGLAEHAPVNFAHRVSLVEAELLRVGGDRAGALAKIGEARRQAEEGQWTLDVALSHELAAACLDGEAAQRELREARDRYAAWGAVGKAAQLSLRIG